jgi:uncharacterized membrane protein YoaK (UPF0700 family)
MITGKFQNYKNYVFSAIKIFLLTFVLGKSINNFFTFITDKYENFNKKILAIIQLIVIINVAYIIHIIPSKQISEEFQITNPSILFSSLMINLQTTMFKNFDIL